MVGRVPGPDLLVSRFRLLVGVMSTATFLGLGGMFLAAGRTGLGAVLLAIGAFRGAVVVREFAPWE